ncbi:MAG: hypothetical protein Q9185_003477 [Variospora sp. 1 TL-2023]
MSQAQAPRVKLPNVTPPKLSLPNTNSWAVGQEQTPTATHRDKYENKPMPPTPEVSPTPAEKPLTARKNRGYIQPAVPLKSPIQANPSLKNRAVTDPIPKPLFTSTTNTVNQLRKKYSQSRNKHKSKEDEDNTNHGPATPPLVLTHKASQILGVYPVFGNSRNNPPASAPPSTHTPDLFRTSTGSKDQRHASPSRQVQSTPVPTRRYLQENYTPISTVVRASQESKEAQNVEADGNEQFRPRGSNDGFLDLTRLGTYGRRCEIEYVNDNVTQRVPSFAGIIEHPGESRDVENCDDPDRFADEGNQSTLRTQFSGEILQPVIYTPHDYAGVWENDPNVGHTLPPFSPFHQPPRSEAGQRTVSQTSGDVPIILQRFPGESSLGSGYTQTLQSQNSWASSGIGNSFAQLDPPSTGAGTAPRFPTHTRTNSVPPPPLSYPEFQLSGPMPPGLLQMQLHLHHHVETCFGSLMRLSTDNADRTVDKMVRRIDDLQETVEKGFKGLRSEVKDVRKEMVSMRQELAVRPRASVSLKDSISSLDEKLGHLDQKFDTIESHYQRVVAELAGSERDAMSSVYSQSKESLRRRSESAHTSASFRPEPRQSYLSGAAYSSSPSAHRSVTSSRGRRSNTTDNGGLRIRSSDERDMRSGAASAQIQIPDIREHPAYRGVAEAHGLNNPNTPIFQAPSFSNCHRVTGLFQQPKPQGQPSLQVRQEPRKFHFTRTTTPVRIPSVLYSGIQKCRKKHDKTLAVFMERTKDLDWSQGRMTDSSDSEGKRNRLDNIVARLVAQPSSPSKRPLASPAERMWRDQTWKQSPGNKARKSPAATRGQETDSMAHSLHLASRLQKFALDVSRTESEALALHERASAQFKPGSPKPRPWMGRTEAANETRHDPEHATDSSVVQKKDLDNFVFDVYVRQVEEKSGEASNELFNATLEATIPEKVGLLVVADEDEETWELYGNEDQSNGDEWDSEEDDENAEGYYGNDYPEDELDSDDEYDNNVYKHWHGAFDDEDFEGNTNWSDDE